MKPIEPLGTLSILLLLVPIAIVCSLSVALKLGQVRRVSIATARSVVQLLAVGLIIGWVFDRQTWWWVAGLLLVMLLVAGFTASGQAGKHAKGLLWIMTLVLGGSTALGLIYFTQVVVGIHEADPRYWIPLGGMMLGNAMTAATLSVERIASDLSRSRGDVETMLVLGASPWQATQPIVRQAIGAALTPTINAMMIVGIVKLPGMMSGQLLGGTEPFQAAMYQLMILIAILFCDTLAATGAAILIYRRFFTRAWQLKRG